MFVLVSVRFGEVDREGSQELRLDVFTEPHRQSSQGVGHQGCSKACPFVSGEIPTCCHREEGVVIEHAAELHAGWLDSCPWSSRTDGGIRSLGPSDPIGAVARSNRQHVGAVGRYLDPIESEIVGFLPIVARRDDEEDISFIRRCGPTRGSSGLVRFLPRLLDRDRRTS